MTRRIPLYPSPDLASMVDLGIQQHLGGRSNRISGMMERYKDVIDSHAGIERKFDADEIEILRELLMNVAVGKSGPWLRDWADLPALFIEEDPIKEKLRVLNASQISALEEYLARVSK